MTAANPEPGTEAQGQPADPATAVSQQVGRLDPADPERAAGSTDRVSHGDSGDPGDTASPTTYAGWSLPRLPGGLTGAAIKPKLRGWLHAGMFPAALVSGVLLTALAGTLESRLACAVYTLSACLLLGISGLYHRGDWSPRVRAVLRRLDHANIFLIIAGTYTPLTILLLPDGSRELLLWGIWIAAFVGIAFRTLWVGAPRWLYTPCYVGMGWAAVFYLPDFLRVGGVAAFVCVIVGGLMYSLGGLVYGIKRPNPSPRWFGFHEVFHSLTLAGYIAHYVGIALVVHQHT